MAEPAHHHVGSPPAAARDRAYWDERYRSKDEVWSGEPNPQLVTEVSDLRPGRSLEVGCGEGGDAVWLARRGWHVTAVDFSEVALGRAAARATAAGADVADRIDFLAADFMHWVPPAEDFDLVTALYVHLPTTERLTMHGTIASAVRPGGTLLVVTHSPRDLLTTAPRPRSPDLFAVAAELEALLDPDGWEIQVSEARPRPGIDADGRTITVHDEVLRARRRT